MTPKPRERFRLQDAATIAALTALFIIAGADAAFATPAGAAMPWDTPLTNLLNNLQGTVAPNRDHRRDRAHRPDLRLR